jgi:RHS repeat-associated protein
MQGTGTNTLSFPTSGTDQPYLYIEYEPRIGDYPGSDYYSQALTDRANLGVNVANGDLALSNNDLDLAGVDGLNEDLVRTYNSLATDQDSLGLGWSMAGAYDTQLYLPSDGEDTIVYKDGSGNTGVFYQQYPGTWIGPPGSDATVTMNGSTPLSSTSITIDFRHAGITQTFYVTGSANQPALLTSQTNSNGDTITYHYTYNATVEMTQLTSIVDTHGATSGTTTFTWDGPGDIYISKIVAPDGRTSQYLQNSAGELTKYTAPDGTITQYSYNSADALDEILLPAYGTTQGNEATIAYNTSGQVSSFTRYVDQGDTSGPTWDFTYDITPSGDCVTDGAQYQSTITDPLSHTTTYCTDAMSRAVGTIDASGDARSDAYDSTSGFLTSIQNGLSSPGTLNFTYSTDGNDNLDKVTYGTSGATSPLTDTFGYGTSYLYQPNESTSPAGNSINYGYTATGTGSSLGNLTSVSDGLTTENEANLAYNSNGTLATSTTPDDVSASNSTGYTYNALGELTTVTAPTVSAPSTPLNAITIGYDSAFRPTSVSTVVSGTGQSVTYTYDDFDRITSEIYKNASGTTVGTITYTYDNDGNLVKLVDSNGTTNYTYNGLNELTYTSYPNGTSDTYTYDTGGNLHTLVDAGGTVTYDYYPTNQLQYVYDPGASTPTTFYYDADGNLTEVAYPNGAEVERGYNSEDELDSMTDTFKNSALTSESISWTLNYTAATGCGGQTLICSETETTPTATTTTTYTYDALGRLLDSMSSAGTAYGYVYTLDGDGNVLTTDSGGTTVTRAYNANNEECWQAPAGGACSTLPTGGTTSTYDPDGEQLTGGGLTNTYNALEQLTSSSNGSTTASYGYLGAGNAQPLTETVTGTGAVSNIIHQDMLGPASDGPSTSRVYFTRNTDGQQIDERTGSGSANTYYYLYDPDGSIIGLTSSTEVLVNQYTYDPYGNRTTVSAAEPDYFGFQDGLITPVGLEHFQARYVNPLDEAWTQQDPLTQLADLTQDDAYGFDGDDPANYADPLGESATGFEQACIEGGVSAFAIGIVTTGGALSPEAAGAGCAGAVVIYDFGLLDGLGGELANLGSGIQSAYSEFSSLF